MICKGLVKIFKLLNLNLVLFSQLSIKHLIKPEHQAELENI